VSEQRLKQWERRAEQRNVTPGPGRAAWVLAQWSDEIPGDPVRFSARYSNPYRCDDCEKERSEHGPVEVMLPDDSASSGAAGVLAGPFCPGCALERLRGGFE
jgi:hypothetical protein